MRTLFICLLLISFLSKGQQRVFFADSLEQRAEVNKIKILRTPTMESFDYQTMKMGNMYLAKFEKNTQLETLTFNQEKKKSPFLLRLLANESLNHKDTYTTTEFKATDELSYDLMGTAGHEASVIAIREANKKKVKSVQFNNGSVISGIAADTSYVKAEILVGEPKKLCALDVLFQNEGANSIQGVAFFGSDTIFITTTNKAKKYHALGVEVRNNNRVIAGMQLPDMHIGPSYTLVDKSIPGDLRSVAYSILSLVLICNENRE